MLAVLAAFSKIANSLSACIDKKQQSMLINLLVFCTTLLCFHLWETKLCCKLRLLLWVPLLTGSVCTRWQEIELHGNWSCTAHLHCFSPILCGTV